MADASLIEFVKNALAAGESRASIADALKKAGWPKDQAHDALASFADIPFAVPVPRPRSYGAAREAFMLIVYFSLLGMIAGQVGALAFAFIDQLFEDPVGNAASYSYYYATSGMRWSIAALLVGYPIFLLLGWRLGARRRRDPERRRSRVRAWLTYVTLIFAAGALIGDLVAVVYQFLSGELETRFLAKAAVVGVISAAILINYSRDAERSSASVDIIGNVLAALTTLVVVALVVWAFTIVRGPMAARERYFDEQRITNIMAIARIADCHYSYYGELGVDVAAMQTRLADLGARTPIENGCADYPPADPATNEPYTYRLIDADSFELCATFEAGWPEDARNPDEAQRQISGFGYSSTRRYLKLPKTAGEACFPIDADKFETTAEPAALEPPDLKPVIGPVYPAPKEVEE
jgi:hypothetical protein